ncbi:MAG: LUD domain-containing protein [Anaerolineales bacterium]|nr:LUD domain-containing protein [Anaerolineales bacterium]
MTNLILENIRRSLARTPHSTRGPSTLLRTGLRPEILNTRLPESVDSETERFLSEVNKLSGKAERLEPSNVLFALQSLVAEQNIRKATVWNNLTPKPITNYHLPFFTRRGTHFPNADKHTITHYDLGITGRLSPTQTGTLVLHSSAEKPRAVSLAPRIHLTIVRPEMLRADMHQVFAEGKDSNYLVFITGPESHRDIELISHTRVSWSKEFVCMDDRLTTFTTPLICGQALVIACNDFVHIISLYLEWT